MRIGVISCGGSNVTSVVNALGRIGRHPDLLTAPDSGTDVLIMPGVGAFGAAIGRLRGSGFDEYFRSHVASGKPAIGICLGMQILFESSEEDPGVGGLGVFPGHIRKLLAHDSPELRSPPNIGYNHVDFRNGRAEGALRAGLDSLSGYYYFLHSFALKEISVPMDVVGVARFNDETFYPYILRENVCGIQFHPERSGLAGLAMLARSIEALT